jgi:hypothetical protein
MGTAAQSQARVEDLITDLERLYDSFPVNQRTVALPRERYEHAQERFEGQSVDSFVEIENDDGDVLHVGEDGAEALPGSVGRPGEALQHEAARAVARQTGVDFSIDGLSEVTILGISNADESDAETLYRILVVFSANYEGGEPLPGTVWRSASGVPSPIFG